MAFTHRLLVLFTCLAACVLSGAQNCPLPPRLRDRMEVVNPGNRELTEQLKDAGLHDRLYDILTHFEKIETTTTKLECIFGGNRTLNRVRDMAWMLGLGNMTGCISRVDFGNSEERESTAKSLENSLSFFEKNFAKLGEEALKRISPRIIPPGMFTKPVPVGLIPWESPADNYHECEIHRADVFFIEGQWHFLAEFTNNKSDVTLGPRERYFFRELVTLDQNNNTQIRTVDIPDCSRPDGSRKRGKAWVETWSGRANASLFRDGDLHNDAGLKMVLEAIDGKENDIVMDSDIASNLAILLLPASLALIPISLFQDVGAIPTVLYVVATDVLSVLPVLIKGVELIDLAMRVHYAQAAYAYGSPGGPVLVVELWVSKCWLKSLVLTTGICLVTIAISCTVIGLILEFIVRHHMQKYKKVNEANLARELEIDERESLDASRRSSLYSERVVNYLQKGGNGGLLFHIQQKKLFRNATSFLSRDHDR